MKSIATLDFKKWEVNQFVMWIQAAFFCIGFFAGLAVFGYQLYWWLRDSIWREISIITGLQWMDVSWATTAHSWLGLHKALTIAPLALTLILIGLFLAWIMSVFMQD